MQGGDGMSSAPSIPTTWLPDVPRVAWVAALVLGGAFLASEHSLTASLADDFTQSAEEMLATAEGGNLLRRLAYCSIAALGVFLLCKPAGQCRSPALDVQTERCPVGLPALLLGFLLLAMIAFTFSSLFWAIDPSQCLRRLLVLGLALLGVFGLARRFNLKELCVIALAIALTCVLIGVGCEIALGTFRPWSGDYRFSGTVHPNTQGEYLATVCFSSICLAAADPPRRRTYVAILAIAIVLLILTKSRTSTVGVLFTLGMVALLLCSVRIRLLAPALGSVIVVMAMICVLMGGTYADRLLAKAALLGRQEDAESFSGRTTIWPVVQQYIAKKPWLGHGYESFWTPAHIEEVTEECQWAVREAHSSYLEMILNLGLAGLVLYCLTLLAAVIVALFAYFGRGDPCGLFWFGMALNGFLNGLFESGMVWISFPTFLIAAGVFRLAYFRSPAAEAWSPRPSGSCALGVS